MKCLTVIFLLAVSFVSRGHNNDFYKGDAYYSSHWRIGMFEKKPKEFGLDYVRLTSIAMDCGNGGISHFKIKNVSEKYHDNLKTVDQLLLKKFKKTRDRPRKLLVYNKDYDFKKWGLAYKYNEDWAKRQEEIEELGHAKYDQLGGADRIIQDWRGAEKVKGLKSKMILVKPDAEDRDPLGGKPSPTLLHSGQGDDYAFVVVLSNTIDRMMENAYAEFNARLIVSGDDEASRAERQKAFEKVRKKPIELWRFYVITDKIRFFEEQKDGEWKVTEVKGG